MGVQGQGLGGHFGIPHPQNIFTTERTRGLAVEAVAGKGRWRFINLWQDTGGWGSSA